MKYLNRSAIVVKYKTPFLEWLTLNQKGALESSLNAINQDNIVYLIEEHDDLCHLGEIMKSHYEFIFKDGLKGWGVDKSKWPKMSLKLFCEWFEISAHSRIKDLETIPIEYASF